VKEGGKGIVSPLKLHESVDTLTENTRDKHRALVSLIEELEAVDWYMQRVDACDDDDLRQILEHNRDEEFEHAAMLLEWLRRRDDVLAEQLKTYLFSNKPIAHG
jgi:ferritin-like protein